VTEVVVARVLPAVAALSFPMVRRETGPVVTAAPVVAAVVVEVAVAPPAAAMLVRGDPSPGAVLAVGVEAPAATEAVATMEVHPHLIRRRPPAEAAVGAIRSATRLLTR